MDCTREAHRGRACLLISLIVLVWNAASTGRHFLFRDLQGALDLQHPGKTIATEEIAAAAGNRCGGEEKGVLSARQKFLLGKRVDINRASRKEIADLPGISEKVAEAVIETRARIGGFRRPEDLLRVKGIKEKRLKKILPFLLKFPNN
ncbi:MAG: helix-hairpin-helix domain-containing protein [Deltaproteobacteria bacterium]|nr:helix-hairpin-helix domain-containing protein [Deltaproteobacteria bacterium]